MCSSTILTYVKTRKPIPVEKGLRKMTARRKAQACQPEEMGASRPDGTSCLHSGTRWAYRHIRCCLMMMTRDWTLEGDQLQAPPSRGIACHISPSGFFGRNEQMQRLDGPERE